MIISGLIRSSTLDFPGGLAAVVFTPGCNLDCFYCHNRGLLAKKAPVLESAAVMAFLEKRQGLLDGVVISGGEPLLQSGLESWLREVKALDYAVKLDSNGTRPTDLAALLQKSLVDYVAIDYKAPWDAYAEHCRASADDVAAIQQTLKLLQQSRVRWELRTTVIPQLQKQDLVAMAQSLPPLPRYFLQPYRRPDECRDEDRFRVSARGMTPSQMNETIAAMKPFQPNVAIRGKF